jgi:hypothetical protein
MQQNLTPAREIRALCNFAESIHFLAVLFGTEKWTSTPRPDQLTIWSGGSGLLQLWN